MAHTTFATNPEPNENAAIQRIASSIIKTVDDPAMHPSTPVRVARAVASGVIPADEFQRVLDDVWENIQAGKVSCPGAYFVASAKNLLARHGIPWDRWPRPPRRRPRI